MKVEVLDPIETHGIGRPAIVGSCDAPVGREVTLSVPVGEVVLRGQDDKGGDGPAEGIHTLDHCCPFAIARLGQLCLATAIRGRNHHARADDTYYEPSLVEVIDIVIYDTILGLDIPHEYKLLANDLWILALGSLVIVSIYITCIEL